MPGILPLLEAWDEAIRQQNNLAAWEIWDAAGAAAIEAEPAEADAMHVDAAEAAAMDAAEAAAIEAERAEAAAVEAERAEAAAMDAAEAAAMDAAEAAAIEAERASEARFLASGDAQIHEYERLSARGRQEMADDAVNQR